MDYVSGLSTLTAIKKKCQVWAGQFYFYFIYLLIFVLSWFQPKLSSYEVKLCLRQLQLYIYISCVCVCVCVKLTITWSAHLRQAKTERLWSETLLKAIAIIYIYIYIYICVCVCMCVYACLPIIWSTRLLQTRVQYTTFFIVFLMFFMGFFLLHLNEWHLRDLLI